MRLSETRCRKRRRVVSGMKEELAGPRNHGEGGKIIAVVKVSHLDFSDDSNVYAYKHKLKV